MRENLAREWSEIERRREIDIERLRGRSWAFDSDSSERTGGGDTAREGNDGRGDEIELKRKRDLVGVSRLAEDVARA